MRVVGTHRLTHVLLVELNSVESRRRKGGRDVKQKRMKLLISTGGQRRKCIPSFPPETMCQRRRKAERNARYNRTRKSQSKYMNKFG